jgi:hypothetical protein
MTPTEYVEGVLQTECDYAPVRERLQEYQVFGHLIHSLLRTGIEAGQKQDKLKKRLFYGRDPKLLMNFVVPPEEKNALKLLIENPKALRLLHAFIGMMTEAGELQEQLYGYLFEGEELDMVNIAEEQGDSLYYHGVTSDVIQKPLEDVMGQNNAKLVGVRYKKGFTEAAANVRDLDLERAVLEAN